MKKNSIFWIVAIAGILLDQVSKSLIAYLLHPPVTTLPIFPNIFHLTYVIYTGAAFCVFRGGAGWLKWLSLIVSMGLIIVAWRSPRMPKLEQYGYGFILAGALGNGIDRFLWGHVIDFLDFRLINFPIFNLADVFINIGIFCLLLANFSLDHISKKRSLPPK
jgi:signal peptidase II